ncbi:phosphatase PAP2 family protein [Flavobacterium silvaticum]|uniref:Phosphatase PAP2 family protein n=1 Tax=Flavobacterium silvaticum TaxID=1852020 RepID=A0A972FNT9_9FLAO|nr:phosphatase PAP2 family protein [Flavobacterium silvaticum]NMH28660.1 phosphatase PAP2 family protein [Flavobacterium silvaticum]
MRKTAVLLFVALVAQHRSEAQNAVVDSISTDSIKKNRFHYEALIIPTALIGYGLIGIESDQIQSWNLGIREEVTEDIDRKITIDDFSQWAPAVSVFALDAAGVKAKNNLKTRATIYLTSFLICNATVFSLKSITRIERPDGSARNSFPSGHTANAFMGAEFLWQEYKDKSIWYGVAGYAVATGTGLFRIYNNRHWLTDVAAGAGIGILSTKVAYWLNPWINKKVFNGHHEKNGTSSTMVMPTYDGRNMGIGFVKTF